MREPTTSPSKRERLSARIFHRRALLLALLVHLFVFVAAPTYSIRVKAPSPPTITVMPFLPTPDMPPEKKPIPRPPMIVEVADDEELVDNEFDIQPTDLEYWDDKRVEEPAQMLPPPNTVIPHDTPPAIIRPPSPKYPEIARMAGLEGRVFARLFVGKDGRVKQVVIMPGNEIFHDEVRKAAFDLHFSPAMMGDRKVGVWVSVPFDFSLED